MPCSYSLSFMSPGSHIPCLYYFLPEMRHNRLKDMLFQVKPHRSQLAPFPADILGGELEIHPGLTQCNLTRWKRNPDTEYFFSRRNILDPVIITSPHSWTVFFIKQMLEDKTFALTHPVFVNRTILYPGSPQQSVLTAKY